MPSPDTLATIALVAAVLLAALALCRTEPGGAVRPITIAQHRSLPYSVMAVIDAPEGTVLVNVWPGGEGE